MGAEGVVLYGSSPVGVDHLGPLGDGSYSVPPVIFIGKATSRPAEYRHLQFADGLDKILPVTVYVGDRGILADPDAIVDTSSQMFGKLAVNLLWNHGLVGSVFMDGDLDLCERDCAGKGRKQCGQSSFHDSIGCFSSIFSPACRGL